jgi:hypothetical protein
MFNSRNGNSPPQTLFGQPCEGSIYVIPAMAGALFFAAIHLEAAITFARFNPVKSPRHQD